VSSPATNKSGKTPEKGAGNLANSPASMRRPLITDYRRPQERECPPSPKDPADQPHPPGGGDECEDIPTSKPPELKPPEKCPEPDCNCPSGPGSTPNCLEDLIAKQAADIAGAKKAEAFKTDLEEKLDSVILQFDPSHQVQAIKPKGVPTAGRPVRGE
jgi:hypothetical protein